MYRLITLSQFNITVALVWFKTVLIMHCFADNHEWEVPDWKGLKPRYEHCSFVPESCPESLWVFGGAEQSGNRSCIQNIRFTGKSTPADSV